MGKKKKLFLSAIFPFLFCFFCFGEEVENEDILVKGTGYGSSETKAIMAAKRDALEKGIGMILISQAEIQNFQAKRDIVITKVIGAVKRYTVISNTKTPDGTYSIEIEANISRATVKEDLAAFHILLKSMERPKVMIIIQQKSVGFDGPTNWNVENSIVKFLKDSYDFKVIDSNVVISIKTSPKKMVYLWGDASTAALIGAMHNADVIITGQADIRVLDNSSVQTGGMKTVKAYVTLRAINCTSGEVIAFGSARSEKVHISPYAAGLTAINISSEEAIKEIVNSVIEKWNEQIKNGVPLKITITKVSSFRMKNAIIHTLNSIPGIVKVHNRVWDEEKKKLLLDIMYKGNTNEFCSRVDRYKMSSYGGSLAVTGQKGTEISIVIQAK